MNMLTCVPVVVTGTAGGRMTITWVGGKWRGGIGIGNGGLLAHDDIQHSVEQDGNFGIHDGIGIHSTHGDSVHLFYMFPSPHRKMRSCQGHTYCAHTDTAAAAFGLSISSPHDP
jgi:hypothetical protein